MNTLITNQEAILNILNLPEETRRSLFSYSRDYYKKHLFHKHSYGYLEIMLYNTIRNKSIFNGFDRLREDTFSTLMYQASTFENMNETRLDHLIKHSLYIKSMIENTGLERTDLMNLISQLSKLILNSEYKEI